MSIFKSQLKASLNYLYEQEKESKKKLKEAIDNNGLTSLFGYVQFKESAAFEAAVISIGFEEDFVNSSEFDIQKEDEMRDYCQRVVDELSRRIENAISVNMKTTEQCEINGWLKAKNVLKKLL